MNLLGSFNYWLHWPMHGGYNFVSGPLSDITIFTAFGTTVWLWWRRHNCHVHRCWRLQWHAHPDHGHPVCKNHHPHGRQIHANTTSMPHSEHIHTVQIESDPPEPAHTPHPHAVAAPAASPPGSGEPAGV